MTADTVKMKGRNSNLQFARTKKLIRYRKHRNLRDQLQIPLLACFIAGS